MGAYIWTADWSGRAALKYGVLHRCARCGVVWTKLEHATPGRPERWPIVEDLCEEHRAMEVLGGGEVDDGECPF